MIVTDIYAFVQAWVIVLEYKFLCEKKNEKNITFCLLSFNVYIKLQQKRKTAFVYKSSRSVKQFP